jgi:hypothetical protein
VLGDRQTLPVSRRTSPFRGTNARTEVGELSESAGKLADRLVELLDVFDLSFFVAGTAALVAIVLSLDLAGIGIEWSELPGLVVAAAIVGAYVVGLLCFALGRVLRSFSAPGQDPLRQFENGASSLAPVLDFEAYFSAGKPERRQLELLYNRLWVHVRTVPELKESFALLKRYWVLAATFDGLAVAVLAYNGPVWLGRVTLGNLGAAALSIATVVVAGFFLRQAAEYRRYQVDELVATVRHWHALAPRAEADEPTDDAAPTP